MFVLSLLACFDGDCPDDANCIDCPDIASLSAVVNVVDEGGEPIEGVELVEFSVNGEDFTACEADPGLANRFECGWELSGEFVVRASHPDYAEGSVTFDVEISDDGCHPITETVELELPIPDDEEPVEDGDEDAPEPQ